MIDHTKPSMLEFVLSDSYTYTDEELKEKGEQSHDDEPDIEPLLHARYDTRIEPREDITDFI